MPSTENQTWLQLLRQKLPLAFWWPSKKLNNRYTISPQTHIVFIMPRPKDIGSCHKNVTENNQGRQRTTPRDNRWFNRNFCHSNSNKLSLLVISFYPSLNNSVTNPYQLSLVRQQSSRSSHFTAVTTGALIARKANQREISCHHRWYLCLIHWIIQSVTQLSYANAVRKYVRTHKYQNSNVVRMAGLVRGSLSVRKTARRVAVPRTH